MNNNRLMRIVLFLGLLAAVTLAIIYRDQFDAAALEAWVRDAGAVAPLLFMLIHIRHIRGQSKNSYRYIC